MQNALLLLNFLGLFDNFWVNFFWLFFFNKCESLSLAQDGVKCGKNGRQILNISMPKSCIIHDLKAYSANTGFPAVVMIR